MASDSVDKCALDALRFRRRIDASANRHTAARIGVMVALH
jgi:hypothetical protein